MGKFLIMKRSAVKQIQEYNSDRHPEILKYKYKAMAESAFRFFRGTCHLFYQDFSRHPALKNDPTSVWVCGDLHIENFGAYKGDNGLAYFDINDFDESTRAPLSWDLSRFLVSLQLSAESIGVDLNEIRSLNCLFLNRFKETLLAGKSIVIEANTATGVIKNFLNQVQDRSRKNFISERTINEKGKLKLNKTKDHWLPLNVETEKRVMQAIQNWNRSQESKNQYEMLDIAYRLAGTGSMGYERYVVLASRNDRYYFLDFKYAQFPSINLYLKQNIAWNNEAERIISVERMMQHVSPALLSNVKIDGEDFVLKDLQPMEDKLNFTLLDAKKSKLNEVIETMAEITASTYLRSGGWKHSSTIDKLIEFASSSELNKPLMEFSKNYREQVMIDYKEFLKAYHAKKLIHKER